ncbi:EscU/YscU/HrcU family type III secretion system export apparatus switch protein, partial [Oligoflexia bacterium]|nr:EscU/YscU/HrcU family type III secretion system export apparatus switch protein [Oligoflexia bacterium]
MSEHSTPEERTEMPTSRRMEQLRKDCSVHNSTEVVTVLSLLTGFLILYMIWGWLLDDMKICIIKAFKMIGSGEPLTVNMAYNGMLKVVFMFGPDVLLIA